MEEEITRIQHEIDNKNTTESTIIVSIIISAVVGFILTVIFNYLPNKKGDKMFLQELILIAKGKCHHIHHFMSMFVIIIAILYGKYVTNDIVLWSTVGLLLGMSSEDLLFKDWYKVTNNCHKKRLLKVIKKSKDVRKK